MLCVAWSVASPGGGVISTMGYRISHLTTFFLLLFTPSNTLPTSFFFLFLQCGSNDPYHLLSHHKTHNGCMFSHANRQAIIPDCMASINSANTAPNPHPFINSLLSRVGISRIHVWTSYDGRLAHHWPQSPKRCVTFYPHSIPYPYMIDAVIIHRSFHNTGSARRAGPPRSSFLTSHAFPAQQDSVAAGICPPFAFN